MQLIPPREHYISIAKTKREMLLRDMAVFIRRIGPNVRQNTLNRQSALLNISEWHLVNCASVCVMSSYAISCLDHIAPIVNEWNTSMKHWCNDTDRGKRKYSEKNQSSCRFGQQKSHTDFFRDWTWATVIRDRLLTAWTMARPRKYGLRNGSVGYLPPFHHRGTGFDLSRVHMDWGFVVDKVALKEVAIRILRFWLALLFHRCSIFIGLSPTLCNWQRRIHWKKGLWVSGIPAFFIATAMYGTGWYTYN
jgi:hypothetical protein